MKTRILHIVPNMHMGGLETFIMNVYRNINRDKIQFDFLEHYREESAYDKEISALGGKIYHFTLRNDNNIVKYIVDLWKFFKEHQEYQVIHCHMESIGALIFFIAKLHGIKVRIGHAHTNSTNKDFKGYIKKIISKPFKYTTTLNLACSDEAGKYLFKNKDYIVIPNAIEFKRFKYDEKARKKIRKELGIDDSFVIGHVGRMDEGKNQLFLIDVFNEYLKLNSQAKLVLVGEGEYYNEIINKINQLGINDQVIFTGVRQDINKIYSAFDLFCFPSLYEGLGIVLIEAQVNGLTCLVSDTVPLLTKITDEIKYLSLNNKEKWVREISECEKKERIVTYNKELDNYNVHKLIEKIEEIYRIEG